MSTTAHHEPRPHRGQSVSRPRRHRGKVRSARRRIRPVFFPNSREASLWAHLEEREEGRLALEADHLFDTSYSWAA